MFSQDNSCDTNGPWQFVQLPFVVVSRKQRAMQRAAIILCGGQSTRMGSDKATLLFGSETMLQRVVRLMAQVVSPEQTVVVAAQGQRLPALAPAVRVVCDRYPQQGPLEGLAAGLEVLDGQAEAAYVTSCDVPLLVPEFVNRLFELMTAAEDESDWQAVVPVDGTFYHPLAAVYRTAVLANVRQLLETEQRRPRMLFDLVRTRRVPVADLRTVDPELLTLMNLNSPEDYREALRLAGLTAANSI